MSLRIILFAGSTTSKFKGVPLYPEFLALTLWPELLGISDRARNPFYLGKKDAEDLNLKIFPHWMENNLLELARKKYHPPEMKTLERLVFFWQANQTAYLIQYPIFQRQSTGGSAQLLMKQRKKGLRHQMAQKKNSTQR